MLSVAKIILVLAMEEERVQEKLQIYADILKLNRSLKHFERLLEKSKEFEELSRTFES